MEYLEAAAWLRERDNFLILTHRRPDGDTIGCAAGLCQALRQLGKTAWVLPNTDATDLFTPYLEGLLSPPEVQPDHVISVDVAGVGLFTPEGKQWLERGVDLAIGHHPSYEGFGKNSCVDSGRAACGELVLDIVQALTSLTPAIALPLYVAISTDTGCFVYTNTSPATHRAAATLMDTGIDCGPVNKLHFRTKSWKRLKLESRMVAELELHDQGKIALAAVTLDMVNSIQATELDLENISAFVGEIQGVETGVTIRELADGTCKLSVRTGPNLNATQVCALLGGGGHAAAAGCTLTGTVEEAKRAILGAIAQVQGHG